MKNKFKSGIVLIFITAFIFTTGFNFKTENRLTGMWELVAEGSPTGLIKIFNANGSLTNIGLGDDGFGISMEGTYQIISDTLYVEKIKKSSYPPSNGTENQIRDKITGDTSLSLQFKVDGKDYEENYKRLKFITGS